MGAGDEEVQAHRRWPVLAGLQEASLFGPSRQTRSRLLSLYYCQWEIP